jgi:PhnB protein
MADDAKTQPQADAAPNMGPSSGVTPYLTIRDGRGDEASRFYQEAFGAQELFRMPADDGKRLMHCHLKINGASVMFSDDFRGSPEPAGVTIHLQVDDARAWGQRAVDAGAEVTMPIEEQMWGDTYGQVRDPFGHSWAIASAKK